MKLTALALFAIGPLSVAAQSAAPASATVTLSSSFNIPVVSRGCPVSMQLQQRLGNQLVSVQNDGSVYKVPANQLMLSVTALLSPGLPFSFGYGVAGAESSHGNGTHAQPSARHTTQRVAFATATVYGFGSWPRAELVSPGLNPRGNASSGPARTLQLRFDANDGGSITELWLPGFGAVRSLNLNSITWSDGSVWKPANGRFCAVSPNPVMLITAHSPAGR